MGKKLKYTPRSRIRSVLRQHIWLRSRERAAALKRESYTCEICKRKQSKAKGKEFKVEVHHLAGVANWEGLIDSVYKDLLCDPENLQVLCKECHKNVKPD